MRFVAPLIVFLLLGSAAGAEDLSACRPDRPATTNLNSFPVRVDIDHKKTVEQINEMHGPSSSILGPRAYTQGYFQTRIETQFRYGMEARPLPSGGWCAYLTSLDFTIGSQEPSSIFIGRQYPWWSCAYKAIEEHEMKHFEMHRWIRGKTDPWLREVMDTLVEAKVIGAGRSQDGAVDHLRQQVGTYMSKTNQLFQEFSNSWSATVDTLAEYRRVHSQCEDWYEDDIDLEKIRGRR